MENITSMHAWMMKRIGATAHPLTTIACIQDEAVTQTTTATIKRTTRATMYQWVQLTQLTPRWLTLPLRAGQELAPAVSLRLGLKSAPARNGDLLPTNLRPANLRPNNQHPSNLRPTSPSPNNLHPNILHPTNLHLNDLLPTPKPRPTLPTNPRPITNTINHLHQQRAPTRDRSNPWSPQW